MPITPSGTRILPTWMPEGRYLKSRISRIENVIKAYGGHDYLQNIKIEFTGLRHGEKLYEELLNNSNIEVSFTAYDAEGKGYVFTLPAANVSTYLVNASGGSDSDLMVSISLTALRDAANTNPALRKLVFIDRIGGPLLT